MLNTTIQLAQLHPLATVCVAVVVPYALYIARATFGRLYGGY